MTTPRLHPAGLHRPDRRRLLRRLRQPAVPRPPPGPGRRLARRPATAARTAPRQRGGSPAPSRRPRPGSADSPLDRLPGLQPAGLHRPRVGPGGGSGGGGHPPGRHLLHPAARRAARRRPDPVPPAPAVDAAQGDPEGPRGARGQAGLPVLRRRRSGASRDGQPGRTEGFCPQVPQPVLVHPKLQAGRPRRRPVRGRRRASPTAAWAGSTSPATATSPTAGSCSRACSTPATPTRWPPRSPSSSSWPRSSTR